MRNYARDVLGMQREDLNEFLWIADEAMRAPLPDGWEQHEDESRGKPYYVNEDTGETQWTHPSDDFYREKFQRLRRQRRPQLPDRGRDFRGGRGRFTTSTAGRAPVAVAATRFTPTRRPRRAPVAVAAARRPRRSALAVAPARRRPALAVSAATAPWRTTPLAVSTKTGGAPVPVASKARPRAPRPRRAWRPPVAVAARTPAAVAVAAAHEAVTVATTAAPSTTPRRRLHTFQGTGEGARRRRVTQKKIALALPQRVHGHHTISTEARRVATRHEGRQARSGTGTDTCQTITEESPDVRHDRRREPGAETCD